MTMSWQDMVDHIYHTRRHGQPYRLVMAGEWWEVEGMEECDSSKPYSSCDWAMRGLYFDEYSVMLQTRSWDLAWISYQRTRKKGNDLDEAERISQHGSRCALGPLSRTLVMDIRGQCDTQS